MMYHFAGHPGTEPANWPACFIYQIKESISLAVACDRLTHFLVIHRLSHPDVHNLLCPPHSFPTLVKIMFTLSQTSM